MEYDWFLIFNIDEFEATGLSSLDLEFELEDYGFKEFLVTRGVEYGIAHEDAFLRVNLEGQNPYAKGDYAVFLDTETQDVYFGFLVPEEE